MTINFRNSHQPERENRKDLEPLLWLQSPGYPSKRNRETRQPHVETYANNRDNQPAILLLLRQRCACCFIEIGFTLACASSDVSSKIAIDGAIAVHNAVAQMMNKFSGFGRHLAPSDTSCKRNAPDVLASPIDTSRSIWYQ
jgi:hypothetical protein